jgi:hypothetical protein
MIPKGLFTNRSIIQYFYFFCKPWIKDLSPFHRGILPWPLRKTFPLCEHGAAKPQLKEYTWLRAVPEPLKSPLPPLCKGGLGGFQRIFSSLDFLNEILGSCTIAVESNSPLASHKSSCYRNSLLLLPFLSHIGGSGYPFIWPGTSLTCGFQGQTSPKPQKAGSTVIAQFFY